MQPLCRLEGFWGKPLQKKQRRWRQGHERRLRQDFSKASVNQVGKSSASTGISDTSSWLMWHTGPLWVYPYFSSHPREWTEGRACSELGTARDPGHLWRKFLFSFKGSDSDCGPEDPSQQCGFPGELLLAISWFNVAAAQLTNPTKCGGHLFSWQAQPIFSPPNLVFDL